MRLGINFMDNDFGNTFHGLAKIFLEAVDWNEEVVENFTKKKIAKIINEMIAPVYLLFQEHGLWENSQGFSLEIDSQHIYLNEEIDEKLKNFEAWANHSFLYIDTENHQFEIW